MLIETNRFGPLEIDESRIIRFREGLLGFPQHKEFALVQTTPDPVFLWLQSVQDPQLAFIVCDPGEFVSDYRVPIRDEDVRLLGMGDANDHQLFVIVNRVNGDLTVNLLGPLVVGVRSLQGRQFVLSDRRYSTRHVLAPATPALGRTA